MKKVLGGCLSVVGVVAILLVAIALLAGGPDDQKEFESTTAQESQQEESATSETDTTEDEGETASEEEAAEKPAKYSVSGEEVVSDGWSYKITGILTNNSGASRKYVQIEYNLYDADGNLLGTALDNINNLEDGGTWKFSAAAFVTSDELQNIASYELADVSGF